MDLTRSAEGTKNWTIVEQDPHGMGLRVENQQSRWSMDPASDAPHHLAAQQKGAASLHRNFGRRKDK